MTWFIVPKPAESSSVGWRRVEVALLFCMSTTAEALPSLYRTKIHCSFSHFSCSPSTWMLSWIAREFIAINAHNGGGGSTARENISGNFINSRFQTLVRLCITRRIYISWVWLFRYRAFFYFINDDDGDPWPFSRHGKYKAEEETTWKKSSSTTWNIEPMAAEKMSVAFALKNAGSAVRLRLSVSIRSKEYI